MHSADGRFVIVFNGEIYNFREMREELDGAGHRFRGDTDTEVLAGGLRAVGSRTAVERLVGMFAFAALGPRERALSLVRDRLGNKPLYYALDGAHVMFASELKAFVAASGLAPSSIRDAIAAYLRYGYVPAPRTIYRGVQAAAGTYPRRCETARAPVPATGISAAVAAATRRRRERRRGGRASSTTLLRDAVRQRMIADVPLGAFLSGGIDSSTVVALMQAQSAGRSRRSRSASTSPSYNEAEHAARVARASRHRPHRALRASRGRRSTS